MYFKFFSVTQCNWCLCEQSNFCLNHLHKIRDHVSNNQSRLYLNALCVKKIFSDLTIIHLQLWPTKKSTETEPVHKIGQSIKLLNPIQEGL